MKKVEDQKLELSILIEKGRLSQDEFNELVKNLDRNEKKETIFKLAANYLNYFVLMVPVFVAVFLA